MGCECYYCQKHKEINAAKRERNVERLAKLAMELGSRAVSAEFDVNYYTAIIEGDWHSSVEILEKALKKAREKKKD